MSNKPVFCRVCKYYETCWPYMVEKCLHPQNCTKSQTYFGSQTTLLEKPEVLNANNNCKLFKLSWLRKVLTLLIG